MPRNYAPVEFNTFVGGLVTEASPLTFPPNASLDEENFALNKDGSRSRRLGMDFESGHSLVDTGQSYTLGDSFAVNSFKWDNAGGQPDSTVICVQVGKSLDFFNGNNTTLSSSKIHTHIFSDADPANKMSFASVDGMLVVTIGSKDIHIFEFDGDIKHSTKRLLIRDLFGVEAKTPDNTDLRIGSNISLRPFGTEMS